MIVGANASGKSNIRDAFRFLHGIGRGYTLAEIVGGKYGADWKPIRGSASGIVRFGASPAIGERGQFTLEVEMRMYRRRAAAAPSDATYLIQAQPEAFGGGKLSVVAENLRIESQEIYSEKVFDNGQMELVRTQPALSQILHWASDFETYAKARTVVDEFRNTRFFDFRPDRMREPTSPGRTALGDCGEYLPVVLQDICADPNRKSALIEQQTAKGRIQVIATTHSPELVSMVSDKTFENTSVTCRLEGTDDAIIRAVADLPNAEKLRKNQGLGRLLAGGWMETALAFNEGWEDDRVASTIEITTA